MGGVVRLARAQAEAEDLLEARGNQMNLGVEPTAGAADGLRAPSFRAPVPSGCTLMLVLSRLATSILTLRSCSICNSSNTLSRTPALAPSPTGLLRALAFQLPIHRMLVRVPVASASILTNLRSHVLPIAVQTDTQTWS